MDDVFNVHNSGESSGSGNREFKFEYQSPLSHAPLRSSAEMLRMVVSEVIQTAMLAIERNMVGDFYTHEEKMEIEALLECMEMVRLQLSSAEQERIPKMSPQDAYITALQNPYAKAGLEFNNNEGTADAAQADIIDHAAEIVESSLSLRNARTRDDQDVESLHLAAMEKFDEEAAQAGQDEIDSDVPQNIDVPNLGADEVFSKYIVTKDAETGETRLSDASFFEELKKMGDDLKKMVEEDPNEHKGN